MDDYGKIKACILQPAKVVIVSHQSPDGDSIGASLAVTHLLTQLGHEVVPIIPDPAPDFLHWMPGFDEVKVYDQEQEDCNQKIKEADIIFCLDFNDLNRVGAMAEHIRMNRNATLINIDHHREPKMFATYHYLNHHTSSTAQLVYELFDKMGFDKLFNTATAECIYTGIVTDTGSFRFSSTSASTHSITSQLIHLGVDGAQIHQRVFDNYSESRLKLLGYALNEKLLFLKEYSTAIIYLTEVELSKFHFQKGDTEGLVNYPLSINWVKIAILITEDKNKVKLSFRSKGDFPVNELAGKYFSGGGHQNAAGGMSKSSVEETLNTLKKVIPLYAEKLNA
ncbi:MAG: DHH family phosphoesterase [Verrucomicrobia bacterium]|nr:DHH family phosphoesterase [Verrucomicrobiota bacterium]|tara:strand:+ start:380 stop:1390 length:1011 start_codon:yes stop_codon:yes gene_type:complete